MEEKRSNGVSAVMKTPETGSSKGSGVPAGCAFYDNTFSEIFPVFLFLRMTFFAP